MEFLLFFLGFGCFFLALATFRALSITTRDWTKVTASVTGFVGKPGSVAAVFRLNHHGKEYFIKDFISARRPLYRFNRSIEVRVSHEATPRFSVQSEFLRNLVHIFCAFGLMFSGMGCLTFRGDWFSLVGLAFVIFPLARVLPRLASNPQMRKAAGELFSRLLFPVPLTEEEVVALNYVPVETVNAALSAHQTQARAFGILLIATGCAGLWGGESWLRHRKSFLQSARVASGIVVRLDLSTRRNGIYTPVVSFREPASDQVYEFRHRVSSNRPQYRPGDRVAVLYSADDPKNAMIDGGGPWNLIGPIGILIFSFLALVLGVKAVLR